PVTRTSTSSKPAEAPESQKPLAEGSGSGSRTRLPVRAESPKPSAEGSGSSPAKIAVGTSGAAAQQVVADDGKLLWASPTSGKPVNFRCVPPEGQIFLFLRPAALLATPEGGRVFSALGPALAAQRQAFETASGFKLEEI